MKSNEDDILKSEKVLPGIQISAFQSNLILGVLKDVSQSEDYLNEISSFDKSNILSKSNSDKNIEIDQKLEKTPELNEVKKRKGSIFGKMFQKSPRKDSITTNPNATSAENEEKINDLK